MEVPEFCESEDALETRVVCIWCGKDLGAAEGRGKMPVIHSLCSDCLKLIRRPYAEDRERA